MKRPKFVPCRNPENVEGQASQPGDVDIEASPSPTVRRVTHALLVVIFTIWLAAIAPQESWYTPGYEVTCEYSGCPRYETVEKKVEMMT